MDRIKTWARGHKKEIVLGAILLLASTLNFTAGYLANREFSHAPIIIEACSGSAKSMQ